MPSHYPTRKWARCPDGWQHQMPNGTWMCGRTHGNQTRGFADDLGLDDFNPLSGNQRFDSNNTMGFGDDLGLDDLFVLDEKQRGGLLKGPKHEQGGIPAIVGGNTPIELEGGEYIVNAQTVDALGTQFLDKLNSTQTTYHEGGYGQGQLPAPSQYKSGGKVVKRNNVRTRNNRTRPVPTRKPIQRRGGAVRRAGGRAKPVRKMAHGGMHCPPGSTMQNGRCVTTNYRKGGKAVRKMQTGGAVMNRDMKSNYVSRDNQQRGSVNSMTVGAKIRQSTGGPGGHQHKIMTDPLGKIGHTDTQLGHSHKVHNGVLSVECPANIGCHSHEF